MDFLCSFQQDFVCIAELASNIFSDELPFFYPSSNTHTQTIKSIAHLRTSERDLAARLFKHFEYQAKPLLVCSASLFGQQEWQHRPNKKETPLATKTTAVNCHPHHHRHLIFTFISLVHHLVRATECT